MFTPFMFEAYSVMSGESLDDIKVIAGKEKDVHMRLLACTSGDQPVIA
ncbi:MSHA biogenesis MshQ domain protein, partial [Vibrio harveyi]